MVNMAFGLPLLCPSPATSQKEECFKLSEPLTPECCSTAVALCPDSPNVLSLSNSPWAVGSVISTDAVSLWSSSDRLVCQFQLLDSNIIFVSCLCKENSGGENLLNSVYCISGASTESSAPPVTSARGGERGEHPGTRRQFSCLKLDHHVCSRIKT